MNFGRKKPQHDFPKMRGGGKGLFGTFPKIHPFLKGQASLNEVIKVLSHPVVPFHVNDQCRLLAECFRTEAALELLDVEVDLPMVLQSL